MSTDFDLINPVLHDLAAAVRVAWPNFPDAPLMTDTQADRINWREALNRLAKGDARMNDFSLPWVVIEAEDDQDWKTGGICNFTRMIPASVTLITSNSPVRTTVSSTAIDATSFSVDQPTGIFPSQRLMIGNQPVVVASVVGSLITVDIQATYAEDTVVRSYDVTSEIVRLLELLRNEIYQSRAYVFQVHERPTIKASSISGVNQQLMKTDYAVQGGTLYVNLLVGASY